MKKFCSYCNQYSKVVAGATACHFFEEDGKVKIIIEAYLLCSYCENTLYEGQGEVTTTSSEGR